MSLSEEDYSGLGHTLGTPKICGSNFWEPLGSTGKLFSKGRARGALLNLPILIHFVIMECACRRGRSSERSLPAPMVIQKDLVMFSLAVAAPTFCISRYGRRRAAGCDAAQCGGGHAFASKELPFIVI